MHIVKNICYNMLKVGCEMELENKELLNDAQNVNIDNVVEDNNAERYIRKDSDGGFIYNKSEINYYKEVQKLEIANNLMLGDYNQNGVYTINQELIQQLIQTTKVYQYSFGNNMFCQSLTDIENFGKIDFAIKIVKDQPEVGTTTAILQLLEPIDKANGYYTNTNIAQLDVYSAKDTNTFVVDVLKKYNVVSKKDAGLIAKKHEDSIDLIILRKKFEDMRKNLLDDRVEEIYKNNFNKKLKLLSKSPVGKKILDEFNKQSYKINGWFVKEGMKGYYKTMDELLQSIIDKNKASVLQDVKLAAALNKLDNECSKLLNSTIKTVDKAMVNPEMYGQNVTLLADNQKQIEIQKSNQQSRSDYLFVETTLKTHTQSKQANSVATVQKQPQPKVEKSLDESKLANYLAGSTKKNSLEEKLENVVNASEKQNVKEEELAK